MRVVRAMTHLSYREMIETCAERLETIAAVAVLELSLRWLHDWRIRTAYQEQYPMYYPTY